jgi:hypothetical protein
MLAYLFSNCSRIVSDLHRYEGWKSDSQICPNGDLMQTMSMKNIAFTFLFVSLTKKPVLDVSLIHRIFHVLHLGYIGFFVRSEWAEYLHLTASKQHKRTGS